MFVAPIFLAWLNGSSLTPWWWTPGELRVPRMRFGLGSSQICSRRIFKILGRYVGVSKNRGTPKSSIFNRVFYYKPSILGYPYIWKHLCICTVFIGSFTFSCSFIFHSSVHIHTNFHTHTDIYSHFGFIAFVSPLWNVCDVLTPSKFRHVGPGWKALRRNCHRTMRPNSCQVTMVFCVFVVGDGCQLVRANPLDVKFDTCGPMSFLHDYIVLDLVP